MASKKFEIAQELPAGSLLPVMCQMLNTGIKLVHKGLTTTSHQTSEFMCCKALPKHLATRPCYKERAPEMLDWSHRFADKCDKGVAGGGHKPCTKNNEEE